MNLVIMQSCLLKNLTFDKGKAIWHLEMLIYVSAKSHRCNEDVYMQGTLSYFAVNHRCQSVALVPYTTCCLTV